MDRCHEKIVQLSKQQIDEQIKQPPVSGNIPFISFSWNIWQNLNAMVMF